MLHHIKKFLFGKTDGDPTPQYNHIDYQDCWDFTPPTYDIPIDKDGYITSFSIDQQVEYKKFFDDYGFVVIRDVLDDQQCQDSINDIWNYIERDSWRFHPPLLDDCYSVKKDLPCTWERCWPSMEYAGIVGGPSVFTKTSVETRANLNIYNAYSTLLGRTDLIINHDRYGFFRPTKNILNPMPSMSPHFTEIKDQLAIATAANVIATKDEWKTILNLHLDMSPFAYLEEKDDINRQRILDKLIYESPKSADFIIENNEVGPKYLDELHIQALINLADNKDEDGGFLVVPGFPRHFEEWSLKNKNLRNNIGLKNKFILIPDNYPLYRNAVRVTARAGSLILWNQKMLHGSSPNNSPFPRLAQFLKMSVSTYFTPEKTKLRSQSISSVLQTIDGLDLSSFSTLQQNIIGMKPWSTNLI